MQHWLYLESGTGGAEENMALDEALLLMAVELQKPVIRFYGWKMAAATFGYFQRYDEVASWTILRPLLRRPTGGGLVPHDADWTYSIVFPPGDSWYRSRALQSYRRLHQWVQASFDRLGTNTELAEETRKEESGQCFIGADKFDLICHGRKVAGAAQRRTRQGLLIQGSVQAPAAKTTRFEWHRAMLATVPIEGVQWQELNLPGKLLDLADNLVKTKYSREDYNRKR